MFPVLIFLFVLFILGSALGGFAFLLLGVLFSRLDWFAVTPFEGAIVCVATAVIVVFFFWVTLSSPSVLWSDDETEDEDELDDVQQRRQSRASKHRRR